jgi:hypothetical protein
VHALSALARAAHPRNPRRALARTFSGTEREVINLRVAFQFHNHIVHVLEDKAGDAAIARATSQMSNLTMTTAFSGIDTPAVGGDLVTYCVL